jgi:hypothetical protein
MQLKEVKESKLFTPSKTSLLCPKEPCPLKTSSSLNLQPKSKFLEEVSNPIKQRPKGSLQALKTSSLKKFPTQSNKDPSEDCKPKTSSQFQPKIKLQVSILQKLVPACPWPVLPNVFCKTLNNIKLDSSRAQFDIEEKPDL